MSSGSLGPCMWHSCFFFVLDVPITTSSPWRSYLQNFRIVSWNFLLSCLFLLEKSHVSVPRIFSRNEKHVCLSSFEFNQSMLQQSPYCYLCTADLKKYVEDLWGTGFYLFVCMYVLSLKSCVCVTDIMRFCCIIMVWRSIFYQLISLSFVFQFYGRF